MFCLRGKRHNKFQYAQKGVLSFTDIHYFLASDGFHNLLVKNVVLRAKMVKELMSVNYVYEI